MVSMIDFSASVGMLEVRSMTGGGVGSRGGSDGVLEAEEALRVFVLVELVDDDTDDARVVGSEVRGCCAM